MYSFRGNWKINLTIWHTVPRFNRSCLQIQGNRKYLFSVVLKITWPTVDSSMAWVPYLFDQEMKIRLISLQEELLLDLIVFLLLQSVCCSKYSAKTTNFSILNVFLRFLHQFFRTHFRIFVTVARSKFHFLLAKVFHKRPFEDNFWSCGLLLPWFNMLQINSISVIIYLFSRNDMCSLKLLRLHQPRTQFPMKTKKTIACNFQTIAMNSFVISHDMTGCQMGTYVYLLTSSYCFMMVEL